VATDSIRIKRLVTTRRIQDIFSFIETTDHTYMMKVKCNILLDEELTKELLIN
jgi:hypothetical protein